MQNSTGEHGSSQPLFLDRVQGTYLLWKMMQCFLIVSKYQHTLI
ncbi:hypothetical protein RUMCAL_01225 [Ruminococcus callidus ATCC 27760]|uniref:Uncharacterized protein n=1 Tax=Ruminococcus callidus ATCC 27760 TaxID=411473 RepID=U2MAU3_9FIRM|nr:hypothetical protein RUMCAL_01225 [Ruminococcus callidus ATCC 27760]